MSSPVGAMALAVIVFTALDLPRLPMLDADIGATPAFAKNERSEERSRGGRGRGNGARSERADSGGEDRGRRVWNRSERAEAGDGDRGRRVWNRPRGRDLADDGRQLGHGRSAGSADRMERRTAAAPVQPPLPPRRPRAEESDFRNHGDRVSTFVALAKELDFNASVGAMQANFGTPFENGLVATDPDTGEFLKDPDTGDFIIDATESEIAAVKPGEGPRTGWEIETDLDVNMDGVVDAVDLVLARDANLSPDEEGPGDLPGNGDAGGSDGPTAILRLGREDGATVP